MSSTNTIINLNLAIMVVIPGYIGIPQKTHILKYLLKRNMLVRIGLIKLLFRLVPILIMLVLIVHFTTKNPG